MLPRSSALALSAYLLLGSLLSLFTPTDPSIWLLDARWLPRLPRELLILAIAIPLAAFALCRTPAERTRTAAIAASLCLAAIAALNCLQFWYLLAAARIQSDTPIPASLVLVLLAMLIARAARCPNLQPSVRPPTFAAAACLAGLFPFLQMLSFGLTSYARPADAILILGARAYADGSPSDALEDRTLAACDLYHQGLAQTLILSGGPGDGDFHETDVMRRLALESGVPADRILIDKGGLNTCASLQNTAAICREHNLHRVLAVSHFYHLPRIKLEAQRADLAVYTVPASQRGKILRQLPYFMAREAAAWWWSFARCS